MPTPEPRLTPLVSAHASLGARMVEYAGWSMPLRYSGETAEHHAVRRAAGLFDVSHMGEIAVSGPQAGYALDYALVGNMSGLAVGRARYSMICAPDGGVVDDLVVYHLDPLRYLVLANASNTETVLEALGERSIGFDATVDDLTEDYALLALQGPLAMGILSGLVKEDLGALRYYSFAQVLVAEQPVLLSRTGYTGEDGFELLVAPHMASDLWFALLEAGHAAGLVPAGLACRDTLRLEAGMCLHGHELHLGVTPYEAGLGRVVEADKPGDFVGREALAARAGAGPVATLIGLASLGAGRVARPGAAVLTGAARLPSPADRANLVRSVTLSATELTKFDRIVGTVTSGAHSPTLGRPIAMASVVPGSVEVGDVVQVDIRGRREPFEVVPLPFYRRRA